MTRWALTLHELTEYSTVSSVDRERPRETFAEGVCDRDRPASPVIPVLVFLVTAKDLAASDSGHMASVSFVELLRYWRHMSWKNSSLPSLTYQ